MRCNGLIIMDIQGGPPFTTGSLTIGAADFWSFLHWYTVGIMEYITKVFIRGESKPINKTGATGATGATGSRRNHKTKFENNRCWLVVKLATPSCKI